ncbi:LysR family transcriptional regulator [Cognatishimia sp. F0-27]|uniref:LysR family transcriptional regulator n=1 Tax=Cognatishimia sp. F0-27 TaxID=2816855 RepID=UPI001D0BF821|nr:LysR family transcriptional regulator [Cognatishimia sp. F0-27]MCC1492041.1 LysR family transcriptional regulator [Cognatishimia sp. F0-27]
MDRYREMEAFSAVVDQGGFTDAARKLGLSKSTVSKHVFNLEERLGARLLNRTTRRVNPTEVGIAYYERIRHALNVAAEAEAHVTSALAEPAGTLRVSVASDFGLTHLSPIVGRFLSRYPEVALNMEFENRHVEIASERYDVAIRIGEIKDPALHAREICQTRLRLVASPDYLEKHGHPQRIDDLTAHKLLRQSNNATPNVWTLTTPSGEQRLVYTAGPLTINDGQALLNAAIEGLGIAYLPCFLHEEALQAGQLVDLLPDLPPDLMAIRAVYLPGRVAEPKVRAFIDFLVEEFGSSEP